MDATNIAEAAEHFGTPTFTLNKQKTLEVMDGDDFPQELADALYEAAKSEGNKPCYLLLKIEG